MLRDAAVILSISVLLLAGLELGLRLAFPDQVVTVPSPETPAYRFHPEYLIALKPNLSRRYVRSSVNGGDTIAWETNEAGFRGPPLMADPDLRVLVYGDSSVQAPYTLFANTFTARLAAHLSSRREGRVEVVNAGVVGAGPDQSLIRLETESAELAPDVVLLHVLADNDMGDLVRNRLFDLDDAGGLRRTIHAGVPDLELRRQRRVHVQRLAGSLFTVRALGRLTGVFGRGSGRDGAPVRDIAHDAVEIWRDLGAREYDVYRAGRAQEFSHFADHYDLDVAVDPDAESSRVKRALLAAVLSAADSVAEARGVPLVVVIQPSVNDVAPENVTLDLGPLLREPRYRPSNITGAIEGICVERRLRCVNLFPVFVANRPRGLYFVGDPHWNDAGQDLAARVVAAYLADNVLAPSEGVR